MYSSLRARGCIRDRQVLVTEFGGSRVVAGPHYIPLACQLWLYAHADSDTTTRYIYSASCIRGVEAPPRQSLLSQCK